jgi:hypothetical protein
MVEFLNLPTSCLGRLFSAAENEGEEAQAGTEEGEGGGFGDG